MSKKFWWINLIILGGLALCLFLFLQYKNTLNFKNYLIAFCLILALHSLIALVYLTLKELQKVPFSFSMVFGLVLILASLLIVLCGWDTDKYIYHNSMVAISIIAYGLSLKDLVDFVDEDKDSTGKYFKGWITMIASGLMAFMIIAVKPMANFVNGTNTDIFALISLGLVLVTISVKQDIYKTTNRVTIPNIKKDIKKALKKLNKDENKDLEEYIRKYLKQKNKL